VRKKRLSYRRVTKKKRIGGGKKRGLARALYAETFLTQTEPEEFLNRRHVDQGNDSRKSVKSSREHRRKGVLKSEGKEVEGGELR